MTIISKLDQSNTMTRESGFSLVELLIATCILSILSTIVIRGLESQSHNSRLNNTTQEILGFIQSIRRRSLNNSTTCVLVINHAQKKSSISNPQECVGHDEMNLSNMFQRAEDIKVCGAVDIDDNESSCDDEESPPLTTIVFTPLGNAPQEAIIKIVSTQTQRGHCVVITEPIGHVMKGRLRSNSCDFSN